MRPPLLRQPSLGCVLSGNVTYRKSRVIRSVQKTSDEVAKSVLPVTDSTDDESQECRTVCSAEDFGLSQSDEEAKLDLYKAGAVAAVLSIVVAGVNSQWVASHEELALVAVFVVGYVGIIIEEEVAFNKAGVALVMAVALWTIRSVAGDHAAVSEDLAHSIGEVSEIIFFLLGAMTIVDVVDAHQGFKLITDVIKTRSKVTLMWLVGFITFFMSSVLDNLTSTIVMVSLLRKLCPDPETRRFLGAVVVVTANAGGAWTPIGDVTTTMLWINGNITTVPTMRDLILPSAVSAVVPMALISVFASEVKGDFAPDSKVKDSSPMAPRGKLVFATGVTALLFVPFFHSYTDLPPYLGMLAGLGAMWLLTDVIHLGEDRDSLKVPKALARIDTEGIIFFLGILLSIASLETAGSLKHLANFLDQTIPSQDIIATAIGLFSAIIDNVPLIAATMGMYDTTTYPVDSQLWQMFAYCAGTGGSLLIIGSAAGVAYMGMEQADFVWYFKRVTPWALVGYFAGIAVMLGQRGIDLAPTLAALTSTPIN